LEPRRGRDVGESLEELVESCLAVIDGGALVVGEWDVDQHALQVVFGFEQLAFAGRFRGVEVAAGAGHAVWALFEEAVGAVAVPEVVMLPRLS
jgi:hypothetical protein